MKTFALTLIFLVIPVKSQAMRPPENSQEADAWYQTMEEGVRKWAATTDRNSQIENLGEYVRKFGRRMPDFPDARWHQVFFNARSALLATPGHAQYFADKLEEERARLKPGVFRGYYTDHVRHYLDETLVHLQSPETVRVIGNYLTDDRDNPASPFLTGDAAPYPGTSSIAFKALSRIGLRDLPVTDMSVERTKPAPGEKWTDQQSLDVALKGMIAYQAREEGALANLRAWWEEVKAGKRTFSFIGQNVEYRFKPDGTWDTLAMANPPDDAPKPVPSTAERPLKPRIPSEPARESGKSRNHWQWVVISIATLLATLLWLVAKRASRKT